MMIEHTCQEARSGVGPALVVSTHKLTFYWLLKIWDRKSMPQDVLSVKT